MLQQRTVIRPALGIEGSTDAAGDLIMQRTVAVGIVEHAAKLLQPGPQDLAPHRGHKDQKLIAAVPRHDVAVAEHAQRPLGHTAQNIVAYHMAQGIVGTLEVVDVDENQRR